jgi:hypothetical protein
MNCCYYCSCMNSTHGLSADTKFAQQELSWVVYALQLTYDDYVNASNSSSIMQSMYTMF